MPFVHHAPLRHHCQPPRYDLRGLPPLRANGNPGDVWQCDDPACARLWEVRLVPESPPDWRRPKLRTRWRLRRTRRREARRA